MERTPVVSSNIGDKRKCRICKEYKYQKDFHTYKRNGKTGLYRRCKKCHSELTSENKRKCKEYWMERSPFVCNKFRLEGYKICSCCIRKLTLDNYGMSRCQRDGLHHHCNDCRRSYNQIRKYGIFTVRDSRCEICNSKRYLVIDHDHKSGKTRGIICQRCNIIIGLIERKKGVLKNVIKYIRKHRDEKNKDSK